MSHKALVKKALTELFVKGDLTALDATGRITTSSTIR
jgi:hypothetical protein